MASFDINFIANTIGVHTVYWRNYEDPINTYPNSESVNVAIPGLQTITINVEGSLYCAPYGITYEGYVISDCQDALPVTNGIPNSVLASGTTWSILIEEQDDPCQNTEIACGHGSIEGVVFNSVGKNYSGVNGDAGASMTVAIDAPTAVGGVQATAIAKHGEGILDGAITIADFGGLFDIGNANTTQTVQFIRAGQLGTTGNSGTVELTFNASARVNTATVITGGLAYTSTDNDYLTLNHSALTFPGPPSGGSGTEPKFEIQPSERYADELNETSFQITNAGDGYEVEPDIDFGPAVATTIPIDETVVIADCPTLDLADYDCGTVINVTGTPTYELKLGETLNLCASPTDLLSLPAEFTAVNNGNCHCNECKNVKIDLSLTNVGVGYISYQTCWDGSNGSYSALVLVTNVLIGGVLPEIDLGCVIPDTVHIDQGSIDSMPAIVITSCP